MGTVCLYKMDGLGTLKSLLIAGLMASSEGFLKSKTLDSSSFVQVSSVNVATSGEKVSFIRSAYEDYFSQEKRIQCKPTTAGTPLNFALNPGVVEVPSAFRPHCVEITSYGFEKKRIQTFPAGYSYGYHEGWVARDARVVVYPGCRVQIKYCGHAPKTHTDSSVDGDADWYPTLIPFNASPGCATGQPTVLNLSQPGAYYLPAEITPSTGLPDVLDGGSMSAFGAGLNPNPYVTPQTANSGKFTSELYLIGVQVDADPSGPLNYPCVTIFDRNQRKRTFPLSPSSSIPLDFMSDVIPPPVGAAPQDKKDQVQDSLRITTVEILPGCMAELSKVSPHQVVDDRVISFPDHSYTSSLSLHTAFTKAVLNKEDDVLSTINNAMDMDAQSEPRNPLSWRTALTPGKYPLRAFLRYTLGSANKSVGSGIDEMVPPQRLVGPSVATRGLAVLPLVRLRLLAQKAAADLRVFYGCITHKPNSNALSLDMCNGEGQAFAYATALGQLRPLRSGYDMRSSCLSFESFERKKDGSLAVDATVLNGSECAHSQFCDRRGEEGFVCKPTIKKCMAKLVSDRFDDEEIVQDADSNSNSGNATALVQGSQKSTQSTNASAKDSTVEIEDLPMIADGGMQQVWQTKRVNCVIPAADSGKHEGFAANGFVVMTTLVDENNSPIEYCLTAVGEAEGSNGEFYVDPAEKALIGDAIRLRRCGWFSSSQAPNGCPYLRQMFTLDFSITPDSPYTPPRADAFVARV
eukprot:GDKJ01041139.1.p1 GENE.GDKJ01041139.1~~GDKJ01041139.1.p1  ORF type:complete len:746 (-),score=176.90 GDKJ01041139.1:325-2562(-)